MTIFDRKRLTQHRNQAADNYGQLEFFQEIAQDVINRLESLDKNYLTVLDINCRNGDFVKLFKSKHTNSEIVAADISNKMLHSFEHLYRWQIDEEFILSELIKYNPNIREGYFDLINFSLGLHWVNDVEGFLAQIFQLLKHDGIFISNFIGGGSLKQLRTKLITIESALSIPHCPRISPFINFQDVPFLLQRAKFGDIIVDQDELDFTYPSCYQFIKIIKELGESNKLIDHTNMSKEMLSMISACDEEFHDKINIINLIAGKARNSIKIKR